MPFSSNIALNFEFYKLWVPLSCDMCYFFDFRKYITFKTYRIKNNFKLLFNFDNKYNLLIITCERNWLTLCFFFLINNIFHTEDFKLFYKLSPVIEEETHNSKLHVFCLFKGQGNPSKNSFSYSPTVIKNFLYTLHLEK